MIRKVLDISALLLLIAVCLWGLRNQYLLDQVIQERKSLNERYEKMISQMEQQNAIHDQRIQDILDQAEQQLKQKKAQPSEPRGEKVLFEVTAYTAGPESTGKTPDHPEYGITASGKRVKENHTIACPKSIPFGTKIYIEDIGVRVCEDRGGAITEGKLDLYIPSLKEARKFGRRQLYGYILKEEEAI